MARSCRSSSEFTAVQLSSISMEASAIALTWTGRWHWKTQQSRLSLSLEMVPAEGHLAEYIMPALAYQDATR